MSEPDLYLATGFVELGSIEELRRYARQLREHYQREVDRYGERLGSLMRTQDELEKGKQKGKKEKGKVGPKRWQKIGSVLVNTTDTNLGIIETMLGVLEEMKFKLSKTTTALKSFEQMAELNIPRDSILNLYLRNGVPERVIVESKSTAPPSSSPDS